VLIHLLTGRQLFGVRGGGVGNVDVERLQRFVPSVPDLVLVAADEEQQRPRLERHVLAVDDGFPGA
jgi:hypothetical protein